jgi:hypothetical protein
LFNQLFVQQDGVQPDMDKECPKCQAQTVQLENGDEVAEEDSDKESVTDSQFSNEPKIRQAQSMLTLNSLQTTLTCLDFRELFG